MARPRCNHCKVAGCPNPPYVYPSGVQVPWCKEHLHMRKGKVRGNQPSMTESMRRVLVVLREGYRTGFPFVELPVHRGVDSRTITALVNRDWMFISSGIDGTRYKITGRGLKALEFYEPQINRRDGICPRCGDRPRHVRSSGKRDAYCLGCLRELSKVKRDQGVQHINTERTCSRCKKRPLHRYPAGLYSSYCKHCARVLRRRNARKERRQLLEAIRAGAPIPLCKRCKAKPRKVFANSISSWCVDCAPVEARRYKMRRSFRTAVQTHRKGQAA